ncbi:MAG: hypothetical protein PWQ57_1974 [Desulfovibrionales bacterium]|jgi:hypothetical protein|nr:hypothetical protein [Desulfovibrionales bacterium]
MKMAYIHQRHERVQRDEPKPNSLAERSADAALKFVECSQLKE